ncbi:MAG: sel1 repeat family protein [Treponema sp.]|nr:sel1 repeat family protein [Treponema sp.]
MELERQNQEIVQAANQAVEQKQSMSARIMQFATDATRILSTTADNLQKIKETGFIDRLFALLPNREKKAVSEITKEEFEELKQFAWASLEVINQRELLTADALITVKNNLNSLVVEQSEMKDAITEMAQRVADRFANFENRVAKVESSQNLETWVSNLKYDEAYENIPETIKFLKLIKGFYLNKQGDYTSNEIKSLKRALDNVGFDFRSKISLEKLLDNLIEELQTFDEKKYLQITKVELPDGDVPSAKELANTLSVPSFVAICSLPENKKLLEDAVEDLREDLGISYEKALQRVVKRRIAKTNGIDLSVETSLFDLGIELISCYSVAPELFGIEETTEDQVQQIEDDECSDDYQLTGILEGIDLDDLSEDYSIYDLEDLLEAEEKTNNPVIQRAIGEQYYFGMEDDDGNSLVDQDYEEAKYWYEKAFKTGYSDAGFDLAYMYKNGQGVEPDINITKNIYELIIEQTTGGTIGNEAKAADELGKIYEENDDLESAFAYFKQAADQGYEWAYLKVSLRYEDGHGVEPDSKKSIYWMKKACEAEDDSVAGCGWFYLGLWYYNGENGCEKNLEKAFEYNKIAAEKNISAAQNRLGWFYDHGKYVDEDNEKAVYWYKKALESDENNFAAKINLGIKYYYGSGTDIDENYGLQLIQEAADAGSEEAQDWLKKYKK